MILPGFLPRLRELFRSGFFHTAFLVASIYNAVRLLPNGHPYLLPENFGRYGIRHVIAEASRHLVFSRRNIDQIFVFFTILAGLILLALQFVLLLLALLHQPAFALSNPANWFLTPSVNTPFGPDQDIAFMILDLVFGLQGVFNSCISTLAPCLDSQGNPFPAAGAYPYPIHRALHQLLAFYSNGVFMVSIIIILYYVIAIAGETAVSGTPFGQRFNRAWAPIRLILFFALLAPLNIGGQNDGLNGAQLITFHVAKYGSNLATNAWNRFNTVLVGAYMDDVRSLLGTNLANLLAVPNPPELGNLMQFLYVAKVCEGAELAIHGNDVTAFIVREDGPDPGPNRMRLFDLSLLIAAGVLDFQDVLDFSGGKIFFVFGEHDDVEHAAYKGQVRPYCGELSLEVGDVWEPGARAVMEAYLTLFVLFWFDPVAAPPRVQCMLRRVIPVDVDPTCGMWPGPGYGILFSNFLRAGANAMIVDAIADQLGDPAAWVDPVLRRKGWAGAAIWYNRIAKMNGAVTAAVMNIPRPETYPEVMEEVVRKRRAVDFNIAGPERFDPLLARGQLADLRRPGDQYIAAVLYTAYMFWENDGYKGMQHTAPTNNTAIDTINMILGTSGIFEMRRNNDVHPLAQLSAAGRGLIEATVRNVLIATAGVVGDGLSSILGPFIGNAGKAASSLLFNIASITLVMGVMLFYVLPFLPFIYFLFAVSGWIKSIFEAIVAMPLWALAHVRIDGEGLPGQAASNGYFLLFEILVRPVLIVFGLLAGISIFSASVIVLNSIFDLVTSNFTGYDVGCEAGGCGPSNAPFYRAPIDEFFFTGLYVMVVYMLGTSSFKLVDQIPNQILRWMGITISTFQEEAGDPAGQVTSKAYRGTTVIATQASGGRLAALIQ